MSILMFYVGISIPDNVIKNKVYVLLRSETVMVIYNGKYERY